MKLIDENRFLAEIVGKFIKVEYRELDYGEIREIFSKHLKDIKDEPQHPSGLDRDKIKIRNELRAELRKLKDK